MKVRKKSLKNREIYWLESFLSKVSHYFFALLVFVLILLAGGNFQSFGESSFDFLFQVLFIFSYILICLNIFIPLIRLIFKKRKKAKRAWSSRLIKAFGVGFFILSLFILFFIYSLH